MRSSWTFQVSPKSNVESPWNSHIGMEAEVKVIHHKTRWCWSWSLNTFATWWKEPTHWKRPWCWERLRAVGQGGDRRWDGWMALLTQWTWVWANSGTWWKGVRKSQIWLSNWAKTTTWHDNLPLVSDLSGKPGVLWSMGLQRVGRDWATEVDWEINVTITIQL